MKKRFTEAQIAFALRQAVNGCGSSKSRPRPKWRIRTTFATLKCVSTTQTEVRMLSSFLSFCLRFFRSRIQLQLEIIFLRKQLEILARTSTRPRLRSFDRIFFSVMTDVFSSWKETLLVFRPETVIRWHRQSFRLFWKWKSRSEAGRPKIPQEQIDLIKQMASDNPLGELHGFMASC